MFEFIESIGIQAGAADVWEYVADVEQWWLASNPDHISLKVRSPDREIGLGTEIVFEELVAGIKGQATGSITEWIPGDRISWEGTAKYTYFGLPLRVSEEVTWQVTGNGSGTRLSTRVQANFSPGVFGRVIEWYARRIQHLAERDREHARRELHYLKSAIESEFLLPDAAK